ncbi:MAG: putative heme d1 biosynthesis radical SAM protein NirJ2 [Syntrophomonadaceae bacterium]|nr:putative heme d1 biosynthesis radical SAM protein NirJ2 [Syntrophomonadaceae bacterium]
MLISWNTTNQCNMRCAHCYRDAGDKLAEELTTAEGKKLIEEIKKAGFQIMIFSGGEALMRADIYELGAYAKSRGLRAVLGTNGTLITPEVAADLKKAGFMAAGVSLDSLRPGKHDEFRCLRDGYYLTLEGMKNLRKAGLPFQIHTTVMDWNVDELEDISDFCLETGAMAHHVFFLVPAGRGADIEEEALKKAAYERTIARLMEKQKSVKIEIKPTCAPQFMRVAASKGMRTRFTKGCLAGISYAVINPLGYVQPCAYLDLALGNVRETPFDKIWAENEVFHLLRTESYEGKCGVCEYKLKCGGCRARAYYYNQKNIMAEDSWCLYQPKGALNIV